MIRLQLEGPVAVVTLDRPERRNALDVAACDALAAAVDEAVAAEARVLVLAGAGPAFCAGADLTAVEDAGFTVRLGQALDALREAPLAVIAAVHGAALGAGTQLAIAADLRVATADARFGIPATKLGLMVDHWTVQRLALLAGAGPARAMLLAAEEVVGEEAHRLGLVQRLGTPEEARAWADAIARLAPLTVQGHKLALAALEPPVGGHPAVQAAFRRVWGSEDRHEGIASFHERRPPVFRGR